MFFMSFSIGTEVKIVQGYSGREIYCSHILGNISSS